MFPHFSFYNMSCVGYIGLVSQLGKYLGSIQHRFGKGAYMGFAHKKMPKLNLVHMQCIWIWHIPFEFTSMETKLNKIVCPLIFIEFMVWGSLYNILSSYDYLSLNMYFHREHGFLV
jgi:hypothetical protein